MDLYLRVAKELGVPLAPFDDGKKAFLFQTSGTILGIHFDTTKMTWTLPLPKLNEYRYAISTAAAGNSVTEKELQSINGYLNLLSLGGHATGHWSCSLSIHVSNTVFRGCLLSRICCKVRLYPTAATSCEETCLISSWVM